MMNVDVRVDPLDALPADLIAVFVAPSPAALTGRAAAVDGALGGALEELRAAGDLSGKREETALLYSRGALPAKRVLAVGLGSAEFTAEDLRVAAAASAKSARRLRLTHYHVALPGAGPLGAEEAAQAVVEGALLGGYAFLERKSDASGENPAIEGLTVVCDPAERDAAARGAERGRVIAEAVTLARDLANMPANYLTPTLLAERAGAVAGETGLARQVLEESDMAELGMGALLGVAQGSDEPAKFIILEHNAGRDDLPTYVVVGKGITFDSGGISLKPGEGMEWMKDDMSGAAVTLGVMQAVARLDLPLHVVGLMPATENLPGGRAYKPGDVLESLSGLTIEVISTDAEGRLILADALAYAKRYEPRAVVDLATLTGACVIALGHVASGLMATDDALAEQLATAAEATGEKIWRLPLYDEYAEQIKSDVADIKNSGGRPAGAISAGHFLKRFAEGYPWAHLDIAGTSKVDQDRGYVLKGATGHGVRLLVEWLRDRAADAK